MTSFEFAKEARNLLYYGNNKIMTWSWGANTFRYGDDELLGVMAPFLQFRVTGRKYRGRVRLYLVNDLYQVVFLAVQSNKEKLPRMTDVFFDELVPKLDEVIEKQDNYTF
jgi:hypothetical protein